MQELCRLSATELAAIIAAGEVSSRDVVEAHLARIDEVNGYVNAVTVVLRESALATADAADRGAVGGPFHGVPFTVKENIDCVGSATTQGVPALENSMPSRDAPVVSRMKAAGPHARRLERRRGRGAGNGHDALRSGQRYRRVAP